MPRDEREAKMVYDLFRKNPEQGRTSYLDTYYKRGLAGDMEPERSRTLVHAAWQAGRDTKAAETSVAPRADMKLRCWTVAIFLAAYSATQFFVYLGEMPAAPVQSVTMAIPTVPIPRQSKLVWLAPLLDDGAPLQEFRVTEGAIDEVRLRQDDHQVAVRISFSADEQQIAKLASAVAGTCSTPPSVDHEQVGTLRYTEVIADCTVAGRSSHLIYGFLPTVDGGFYTIMVGGTVPADVERVMRMLVRTVYYSVAAGVAAS